MNTLLDDTEHEKAETEEVQPREIAPGQARKVTETFLDMNAWQIEMKRDPKNQTEKFYGSRKVFMENCRVIYPVEVVDASQPGSEIVKARERLEGLDLISTDEYKSMASELSKTARNVRAEQMSDPIELIREIDHIVEPASRVVESYIKQYPGTDFEADSQMDVCFKEIYRLELLRRILEDSLSVAQQGELAGGESVAKEDKNSEAYRVKIDAEAEANWERFMHEETGMGLDAYIEQGMSRDPEWTMFGNNTDRYQKLHDGIKAIREDYADDPLKKENHFVYKERINELLKTI